MNKEIIKTIFKSSIIILILIAIVFALRAPAADLNLLDNSSMKDQYIDDSGLPYFSEMDSYYNLRLTESYIDHGYVGDVKYDNGTEVDMHRLAPDGEEVHYELGIVYVTSFLYSLANVFGDYTVKEVAFWTGAIIASLAVIPAFIFARRLTNVYGAIAATLIIALAPNYFTHTFPGFFDTDMFYYIFSLFFIFFFIESMRTSDRIIKIIFAVLAGLSIGLFSQAWTGYIFYVALIATFVVVYLIVKFLLKIETEDESKYPSRFRWFIADKDVQSVVIVLVLCVIVLTFTRGFDVFLNLFNTVANLLSLQTVGSESGFPNVLISVGEMQVPSLLGSGMYSAFLANTNGVVNGIGGITVLFAALFTLYTLIRKVFELNRAEVKTNHSPVKPKKADRKAPSQLLDDSHKFSFSFKSITNTKFDTIEELCAVRQVNLIYAVLFVVWIIVAIVAVSRGSRFITVLVLPFALLTGIFIGYTVDYFKTKKLSDKLTILITIIAGLLIAYPFTQINMIAAITIFLLILAIILFASYGIKNIDNETKFKRVFCTALVIFTLITPSVCGAYVASNNVVPGHNDAMWDSMVWINDHASEDTVISSWWDFGYLFEIAGDRQVTFDGGSQTGQRAFWLGQAMMTDDLDLSAGIFRMLNSKGSSAVDYMYNITHDNGKTTSILLNILPLTAIEAHDALVTNYSFTSQQADHIIKYTHPDDVRPTIFVASSDMLQKASWWTYFGDWNFNNQSSKNYGYFIPTEQLYLKEDQSGKLLLMDEFFNVNIIVNRTGGNTTATTEAVYTNGSQVIVNNTVYNPFEAGRLIVDINGNVTSNVSIPGSSSNTNYTILLLGYTHGNSIDSSVIQYMPILMSNELVNSMFTKLYIFGGAGQDVFTCIHSESGVSLWQVNFNNTVAYGNSS